MNETFLPVLESSPQPNHWHKWALPSHGLKVETVDAHVCGQPLRLILSGYPLPRGLTMIDKCRFSMTELDHLRGSLLLEPRGHPDMYACILTPSQRASSDFGTLFLHRSGICPMSAHGIIAVATMCIETGIVETKSPETLVRFDTPAGLIRAYAKIEDSRVSRVFFENVPSYVAVSNASVDLPGIGKVTYDIAYGGEFYAYVEARSVGVELVPERLQEITNLGIRIGEAVEKIGGYTHPSEPVLSILSGVVFTQDLPKRRDIVANARQVCVFTDGSVDRSASGTALSGRLAMLHATESVDLGQPYVVESLLGGTFTGRAVREGLTQGNHRAIIVEIEGKASITGRHCFFIDPDDPLKEGFLL